MRLLKLIAAIFCFSIISLSAIYINAQTCTVQADLLNIRSLASTSSDVVIQVSKGAQLTVVSNENGWYKIRTDAGFEGFVKAEYVTLNKAYFGKVTASSLMLRSSTGTASPVIAKLPEGAVVELLAYDGAWYKVMTNSLLTGYASAEYIVNDPSITSMDYSYAVSGVETSVTDEVIGYGYVSSCLTRLHESTGDYSTVKALLTKGEKVSLLVYDGAWYKVRREDGTEGYVSVAFIALSYDGAMNGFDFPIPGFVDATTLNFRTNPATWGNVLTGLPKGTEIQLMSLNDSWYRARLTNGSEGYVSSDYISLNPVEALQGTFVPDSYSSTPKVAPTAQTYALGAQIITTAYQYMGVPYRYATEGPDSFDCSGFTMYVMNLHGISLPRPSRDQYYCGFAVDKSELIAGDLVFFSSANTSSVAHVGIYVGNGEFIHASSGNAYSVTVSSLSAPYYTRHYIGAKRVI